MVKEKKSFAEWGKTGFIDWVTFIEEMFIDLFNIILNSMGQIIWYILCSISDYFFITLKPVEQVQNHGLLLYTPVR